MPIPKTKISAARKSGERLLYIQTIQAYVYYHHPETNWREWWTVNKDRFATFERLKDEANRLFDLTPSRKEILAEVVKRALGDLDKSL